MTGDIGKIGQHAGDVRPAIADFKGGQMGARLMNGIEK
jgi:hypothetical protein